MNREHELSIEHVVTAYDQWWTVRDEFTGMPS